MRILTLLLAALFVGGCATYTDVPHKPAILKAVGHGAVSEDMRLSPSQRRLLGARAAKLDAYRNLAEQVYGLQLTGQSTVHDMMLRNDSFRTYVDAYLRGAHVVTINPLDDATYEVTVELDVGPGFYGCFNQTQSCAAPAPARSVGCGADCNGVYPYVSY